jgi:hypothetical protein
MGSLSRSQNRKSSTSGERRRAQGSRRQRLAGPTLAAREPRRIPNTLRHPFRERGTSSTVLTAAVNLFWTRLAPHRRDRPVLGLVWAGPSIEAAASEGPPGSGIVLRTEVTAIWIPPAFRDLARQQAGPLLDYSADELQTYLGRDGWKPESSVLLRRKVESGRPHCVLRLGQITHI